MITDNIPPVSIIRCNETDEQFIRVMRCMHNTRTCSDVVQKKIEDTKEVIRYRKSKIPER